MKFPWIVFLELNGRPFGHSPLFDDRAAAQYEYIVMASKLKRSFDAGKINSYHLFMRPIPWC